METAASFEARFAPWSYPTIMRSPVRAIALPGNITKCLQPRKLARGKSRSRNKTVKPTHSGLGKADDIGEETGTSTRWDGRGRGPGIWGKIGRIESGRTRWQQGLVATCRDSRTEVKN